MRWMVTGGTGFIGQALIRRLDNPCVLGRKLDRLQKMFPGSDVYAWEPEKAIPPLDAFREAEGIFHLAGDPVGEGRWTVDKKQRIRDSRVLGTRNLLEGLSRLAARPQVLVCASAVGFYGDGGEGELDESSPRGQGFLAEVCEEWENESRKAEALGMRVVRVRLGVVLAPGGGALAKMLPPFRMGFGGRMGNGNQWMPWVALEDAVGIFLFAAQSPAVFGPINATSPNPVTNTDFTQALGQVLHRPTFLSVPALALRLGFGEMSQVLLASQKVLPKAALEQGYVFQEPDLRRYLKRILGGEKLD